MEYRNYRDTGLKTSLLGFGCMRFPMLEDGKTIDRELSARMVDLAYANGVNYFDTAYVYQQGESERTIGAILGKYPRESFYLTSKLPNHMCKNADDVLRIFNESLTNCGVEYFDFYLCHNVNGTNIDFYTGENYIIPVLEQLKAEGKIRYLGFSSHGKPEQLQRMVNVRDWDFVQIQFNYLDWSYQDAKQQYEILEKAGLPIMVMEPVRGGRLANLGEAGKALEDYASGKSSASWALRWAASFPAIQVVLSGMSDMAQVEDNLATFNDFKPIGDEEKQLLEGVVKKLLDETMVPCTACRYCTDGCPQGLNIPDLLSVYSDYLLSRTPIALAPARRLPADKQPSACMNCGHCVMRCPQGIRIPSLLSDLANIVKKTPPMR